MASCPKNPKLSSGAGAPLSEQAFLRSYDASRFEHPSVTVDVVLLSIQEGHLHTLLVQRKEHPFLGSWALPGGFLGLDESLEQAAARVLAAKAGLEQVFLEQLYTFGSPERDPRTRVLSVVYCALVDRTRFVEAELATRSAVLARIQVPWAGEEGGPVQLLSPEGGTLPLAFDHGDMIAMAVKRLRGKLDYSPVAFQFLPERFTLFELQKIHETILNRKLNKDSFRKRLLAKGLLEATGEMQQDVDHRPAALYRYAHVDMMLQY
jgi:8-oxo-dGTP diphosphatase